MRVAGDCSRGLRRMAICAALGLTTIRLDAQRIDALAVGASRVSAQALDSIIVRHVNNETLQLMGAVNEEQLLGPISRFWTDKAGFIHAAEESYKGLERISSVSNLTSCDGRTIDIFFTLVFADEHSGIGKDIIGAIDITEQSKAVRALHASEKKYRDLFNYMPIALWQARD